MEKITQMYFKTYYLGSTWKLQKEEQELLIDTLGGLLPVVYMHYKLTD